MALAGTAGAGVTVDLIWEDTGTALLSVDPGDPGQSGNCAGFFNQGAVGRCMRVVWQNDEPLFVGSNSISWDTTSGLQGVFASFFPSFNAIPVGKSAAFLGFPDSSVDVDNVTGIAGLFTGSTNQVPPGDGSSGLPICTLCGLGNYTVGTIVFDTTAVGPGTYSIASIIQAGLDGFVGLSNVTITDVTLNEAILTVVPEPGTASLLGLGFLGLIAASRRRKS